MLSVPCYNRYLFLDIRLINTQLSSALVCAADQVGSGPGSSSPAPAQVGALGILMLGSPGKGLAKVVPTGRQEAN